MKQPKDVRDSIYKKHPLIAWSVTVIAGVGFVVGLVSGVIGIVDHIKDNPSVTTSHSEPPTTTMLNFTKIPTMITNEMPKITATWVTTTTKPVTTTTKKNTPATTKPTITAVKSASTTATTKAKPITTKPVTNAAKPASTPNPTQKIVSTTKATITTTSSAPVTDYGYRISGNNVTITKYKGEETQVVVPNKIEGKVVTAIGDNAFDGCTKIKSIKLPNTITTLGAFAFRYCVDLESINIPFGVKAIPYLGFACCYALKSINIPSSVTTIEELAFLECINLQTIVIPSSVNELVAFCFADCTNLKTAYFEGNEPKYNRIALPFVNAAPNFKIYYHKGKTGWPENVGDIWNGYPTATW
ncbi:MAG: leucine-rich repeat domain-containing protein [Oscillospiraceae bacterium]|nr:leucine-rich repeat domain-containing protein [Oscillospiraceae bacterium]